MYLMCVSLNYHQLPVDVRGKYTFSADEVPEADRLLNGEKSIFEDLLLSTCNRTEVYAVVDQIHTGRYYIKRFLAEWFHCPLEQFNHYVTISFKEETARHLFRVTAGLDSQIKGEPQILGQVKDAFAIATKEKTTGVIFKHLFRQAITFAKRMHTKYRVSELAQSTGQAGLHQIKTDFGSVKNKRLAVVGMGHIGAHTAHNASNMGFSEVVLLNRTNEKAQRLAQQYGGVVRAEPFDQLSSVLKSVDAAVFATATKQPLLEINDQMGPLKEVVDLGVPRNVTVADNCSVNYYDIDHLQDILSGNEAKKEAMLAKMEAAVPAEVHDFYIWQKQLHIVPVIRGLRENSLKIEGQAYDTILRKLPDLTAHQRKVINKHMKGIINQMIRQPIKEIKELSVTPGAKDDIDFFCKIFGMDNLKVENQDDEK